MARPRDLAFSLLGLSLLARSSPVLADDPRTVSGDLADLVIPVE